MSTLSMKHFDVLDFVKKSKELGASEAMAEFQARQIETAIEIAVGTIKEELKPDEFSTKGDILQVRGEIRETELRLLKEIEVVRKEIALVRNELVKWVLATGIGTILAIAGLLKFMIH